MLTLIINPIAGHGRAKALIEKLSAILKARDVPFRLQLSDYPGHAVSLAREAARQGAETVVAVGGDGTVSEVATGLLGTTAKLGIIPAGTGNDYCRCLHIPSLPMLALDVILAGKSRKVDAMRLNQRTFINIINVGFDNEVALNAGRFKWFGKLAYLLSVFYTLPRYKGKQINIELDGRSIRQKAFMLIVGSGSHYGGGMCALPMADPSDGLLDVCLIDDVSVLKVIRLLPLFVQGKHERCPEAHFFRCKTLRVEGLDTSLSLGGDGEYLEKATPAAITTLPGAITVMTA